MLIFFQKTFVLIWKDFLIDFRRRDNIPSMLLFLLINFLIFKFSISAEIKVFKIFLPSIIWVLFIFTGVLGLEKSLIQERESGCISGLLIAPLDKSVLFLGKMIANTLFLMIPQIIFIPPVIILFDIELKSWFGLFSVVFLGTIGFSSLGTLLSLLTSTVRGREMLLPILLFPLMIPGLLCVVNLTELLFFETIQKDFWSWLKFLIFFDLILIILSFLGFEFVLEE